MFDYFLKPEILANPRGKVLDADIICPQAFGRNTWADEEVAEQLSLLFGGREGSDLTDLERFYRLENAGFRPGSVNEHLARQCHKFAALRNKLDRPFFIIGQWEVLYALFKAEPKWYETHQGSVIAIWPPEDGSYLATRGMLQEAKKVASDFVGPEPKILIVSQAMHLARCARLAEKIFGKRNVIVPCPGADLYDPESVQPWTRDRRGFLGWEIKARIFEELPGWARAIVRKLIQK
ncbi:MAG: hypothetical protein A2808_02945 [Candidatus Moranbacteria bacterium RIFCSPHIGHO2_01_FULL_55_24]|nr:MAG: hypothetical protein A2808_02945 [Candidatus Moranbacteria bacterium RIFCSPHIGHO2_01_FULL_55_24]